MLRLNNFLCCLKLETGGIIIGWLNLISNVCCLLFSLFGVIFLSHYNCEDFRDVLVQVYSKVPGPDFAEVCSAGRGFLIFLLIVIALLSIGFIAIAFLCIKGTENRDHKRVKPMMIFLAIFAVLSFLSIFFFTINGVVTGLFYGVYYGYCFLVIESLRSNFKEEYGNGLTSHYLHPVKV